jgi:hypothetical protein
MSLETLVADYDATLVIYNKAYADYISSINSTSLTDMKGYKLTGVQQQNKTTVADLNACKAMCSNDIKCVGAAYNADKMCIPYSSVSDINPGSANDYAIIKATADKLRIAQSLNARLSALDAQIKAIRNTNEGVQEEQRQNDANLRLDMADLNAEQAALYKIMRKHDDIDATQEETGIQLDMNQYWYWLVMLGIVVLIGLLFFAPSDAAPVTSSPSSFMSGGSKIKTKYWFAFIPLVVMMAATFTATQIERFIF